MPDGRQVLDTVEALYCGFSGALKRVFHNTTCTCAACRNIANLDLKLFVHYGPYVEQSIAGRHELGGSEVIRIHRLLKNSIAATIGIPAYAAFTEAAVSATALVDYFADAPRHSGPDEQLGDTSLRVLDMRPVWKSRSAQGRIAVGDDEPRWFPDVAADLPVPSDRAWHYLTDPELRTAWGVDVVRMTLTCTDRGRATVGTIDHCAHGNGLVLQFAIVDWRPGEHISYHLVLPGGTVTLTTSVTSKPFGSRCSSAPRSPSRQRCCARRCCAIKSGASAR